MSLLPIDGKDGYFRDSETNAIVNKNTIEYNRYVANRERLNGEQERLNNMEKSMDDLKHDLNDIKSLLKEFLR